MKWVLRLRNKGVFCREDCVVMQKFKFSSITHPFLLWGSQICHTYIVCCGTLSVFLSIFDSAGCILLLHFVAKKTVNCLLIVASR